MKKVILLILTNLFLICLTLGLAGCDNLVSCVSQLTHNHSYSEQVVNQKHLKYLPTCVDKGVYYFSCKCGKNGFFTFEHGEPLGHSFTNYVSDKNATFFSNGTKTAICDRQGCNEQNTIEDVGSRLNGRIVFNTLGVTDKVVYGTVSNNTQEFSFIEEISIEGDARFAVSLDKFGISTIETKSIPLVEGDNYVYVIELVDNEPVNVYEVTIRRRPLYLVEFITNCQMENVTQHVEEGCFVTPPEIFQEGYQLVGWNYDFANPIMQNQRIEARWSASTYTIRYNPNSGEGYMGKTYCVYDEITYLKKNSYTKNGYKFGGWNTESDGSGDYFGESQGVFNLTLENNAEIILYAVWKVDPYEIAKYEGTSVLVSDSDNAKTYYLYDGKTSPIFENIVYYWYDFSYSEVEISIPNGIKEVYFVCNPEKEISRFMLNVEQQLDDLPVKIYLKDCNLIGKIYTQSFETNVKIELGIEGENVLSAPKGESAIYGFDCIDISGNGNISIYGGDGEVGSNGNGLNGCAAIDVRDILISNKGKITIYGGNGGKGIDGTKGSSTNNGNAGNGSAGGNGGNGAEGIMCYTIRVFCAQLYVYGGNGGAGGRGGDGGNITGCKYTGVPKCGRGGNGGNGGDGAHPIYIKDLSCVSNTYIPDDFFCLFLCLENGDGGAGGRGGNGGNGTFDLVHYCDGGNGGNGGKGGNSYINIINCSSIKEGVDDSGSVGDAGEKGKAGKGNGNSFWSAVNNRYGSAGNPGSKGSLINDVNVLV